MKHWTTILRAIDPVTGELKKWCGPYIEAPTKALAHQWCQLNGMGYLSIEGELIAEIPTKEDGFTPDWANSVDYKKISDN